MHAMTRMYMFANWYEDGVGRLVRTCLVSLFLMPDCVWMFFQSLFPFVRSLINYVY